MSNILKGLNEGRNYGRDSWDSNMPGYQGDYGGAENFGRRNREWDEDDRIDARIRAEYEKKKEYEQNGKFWLKLKDSQRHLPAGPFTGKQAANTAAIELLKQQPELKGNLLITAYGPDETQGVAEGQLDELSNNTLASYKKKAGADATQADKRGDYARGNKRMSGIVKATKKEFDNDEKKVPEGRYDSGDYYNARQGREYGAKSSQVDSGAYEFEKEVHRNEPGGEQGRPKNLKGVSKSLPADAFGRTTGKIPAGKTGRIHSMMNDVDEDLDENLHKWFKEKWVRFGPDGKIRGDCARGDDSEGKPKCLPQSKAQNLGKEGRASAASRKRREDPNPERSGKAINVATKKKSNEGMAEGYNDLGPEYGGAYVNGRSDDARMTARLTRQAKAAAAKAGKTFGTSEEYRKWHRRQKEKQGVAEGSLNEFAPDGFNGGDDDEGFSPEIAKMAQEDGFTKGASLADGATLERAITINYWHSQHGGMYKQYFAKGFKAGRMEKIRHNNKQYNLNLKLMKDGSIRHGEQGVAEGSQKWYPDAPVNDYAGHEYHKLSDDELERKRADQKERHEKLGDTKAGKNADIARGIQVHRVRQGVAEEQHSCPHCGGEMVSEELMNEKKDACYYKVKSRYKVWPSAYASGALVKCRKSGADSWGNGGKKNESIEEGSEEQWTITVGSKTGGTSHTMTFAGTKEQAIKKAVARFGTSKNPVVKAVPAKQGVAEGLNEMDKSAPQPGRDGKVSHSTYGSRDKKGFDYFKGKEAPGKPITKKQMEKDTLDILKKQGMAEDQLDEKWTKKYKDSINCSNPKGFSQKAHCAGKQKNESAIMKGLK